MTGLAVVVGAPACWQPSPFTTDLPADERDKTGENLARLAEGSPPDGAFRFAVLGDSHGRYDELREVVDVVRSRNDIELVLHLGDMTDLGLREEFRWSLAELERLDVPFLTTIGNHDALSNGKELYRNMFGPYDYSFTFGRARFVCFNSNRLEFDDSVPDLDFLTEATVSDPNLAITIAVTHQPSADSGARPYAPLLQSAGVGVLVTGHIHEPHVTRDGLLHVAVGAAESGQFAIVEIDGARASVAECGARSCGPFRP